jgi:hypothetical protein
MFQKLFVEHDFPKIVIKIHGKFTIHGRHIFSWFERTNRRRHFFHALFLKHRSWNMRHIHRTRARTNIAKRNTKRRNNFKTCNFNILIMDKSPRSSSKNNYSIIINSIDVILQQKQDRKKHNKKSPNPKIKTMMKMCNKKRKPKTIVTSCYFQN